MFYSTACVCSSSTLPCTTSNAPTILQTNSSIKHHHRRRYNRHDSSESHHAANGSITGRAESITSATSASKRQKRADYKNKNYQHQLKRSTSSPSLKVSSAVFFIKVIHTYVGASYVYC